MNLNDYSYRLPEELIAQKPHHPKDECKLLVLQKKGIDHKVFKDIISYLKKDDVLVLNNTKVTHSKIIGEKETGSPAEIVLLKKIDDNKFECKIKTKNPHVGTKIILNNGHAIILSKKNIDTYIIELSSKEILKKAILPTPPYIKNHLIDSQYQTEYAKVNGSLAAPTAGLHFTRKLLNSIQNKGVRIVHITLHVSYGTFKKIDDIKTYVMDPEYYIISKDAANTINNRKGRLIVCGTTTLKALETSSMNGKIIAGCGESKLFIYPPYKFQCGIDALITNFHLPRSTLLLLTCAFSGKKRMLSAYKEAVLRRYRFYSLGDALLIWK